MVSPETIKEFQEAVKKDYGVVISLQEAEETLRGLVGYYDKLAEIDSREKVESPALIS